ncbi:MAG: EthD family reductase [Dehalococcoidia bacterium]
MLKIISPANRHLTNRPALADFTRYWTESHGPLFSNTKLLWGYVQHHTLPEAFEGTPKPTFDGASVFYYESLDALRNPLTTSEALALREEVGKDDRQLFDRSDTWPMHLKRASVVGTEKVLLDGAVTPSMVKLVLLVSRLPGLTIEQFVEHWQEVHAPLVMRLPGLRRYVQNHPVLEAYGVRGMSHDGWAELWFDDLAALQAAYTSPQWSAVRDDSAMLFAEPRGVIIARETVQKWDYKATTTFDVSQLSEDDVRRRLEQEGYRSLAADPDAPGKILAASRAGLLAVWTNEHLVTTDASRIDARPER